MRSHAVVLLLAPVMKLRRRNPGIPSCWNLSLNLLATTKKKLQPGGPWLPQ